MYHSFGAAIVIFFAILILIIWVLLYWKEISTQYRWESIAIIVAIILLLAAYGESNQWQPRYTVSEIENDQSINSRNPTSDKSVRRADFTPVKETESVSFTPPASLMGKSGQFFFKSGDSDRIVLEEERGTLEFSLLGEVHS